MCGVGSLIMGLRSFSCNTKVEKTIRTGEAMWKRNWWRSSRRGRPSDYGGTVKMAVGALVTLVLVSVLLQLLGLT